MAVKYGMLIDLGKCVGCGACAIACKTENNTRHEDLVNGRKYNWADYHTTTKGTFPDTTFEVTPVLCNHCGERTVNDPPCVQDCPVTPDVNGNAALYKTSTGITMRDDSRCIGCQQCLDSCPFSSKNVITDGVQWSVNHYNPAGTSSHPFWEDTTAVVTGGTSTPAAVALAAGTAPPCKNDYTHTDYSAVRPANVSEKCYFCDHRLLIGEQPYCVVSCPAGARIFGDQNDSNSQIAQLLAANNAVTLASNVEGTNGLPWQHKDSGTKCNVYYMGPKLPVIPGTEEVLASSMIKELNIYPNPAKDNATVEFELETSSEVTISLYDIQGKTVESIQEKQFTSGKHSIDLDVSKLPNGRYICSMQTKEGFAINGNIVILR